ncbi:MAG: NTP transferase domain-containing protein [Elusimicrobiota bacterium]|jgi:NDP-sugar pyrophosphorylase family protein
MKIIVPLAGQGWRFRGAGYSQAKPLIPVDGVPMVRHVVDLFPGEKDFLFIANAEHASRHGILDALEAAAPGSRTVVIPPHREGPVASVLRAFDQVSDDDEVIVNYCDFSKAWDYPGFLKHTRGRRADGAVAAYKGFHPHMLSGPNYAFLREERQWLSEIREKRPFTEDRMAEYASDGTYYFRTGALLKKYFTRLVERGVRAEGEFYVSMAFNLMVEDGLRVSVYAIEQMLQWGTPEDLREYQRWSDYFRGVAGARDRGWAAGPGRGKAGAGPREGTLLMPMAGEGRRFREAGFKEPKPLIKVNGTSMFAQALRSLPRMQGEVFVTLDRALTAGVQEVVLQDRPGAIVRILDAPTKGGALTCAEGLPETAVDKPLLIAPCDAGVLWDPAAYDRLLSGTSADVVVWTASGYEPAARKPQAYGWVKAEGDGRVSEIGVKRPLSSEPIRDRVILGVFMFKSPRYFQKALDSLLAGPRRPAGEVHVDHCAEEALRLGMSVRAFDVDGFACWGTPEELATYRYWQKFFHRASRHPYDLSRHPGLEGAEILAASFEGFRQEYA